MKKRMICILFVSIFIFMLVACGTSNANETSDFTSSNDTTTGEPLAQFMPLFFANIEEFEEYEKSRVGNSALYGNKKNEISYAMPQTLPNGYALSQITKRENTYIMFEYKTEIIPQNAEQLNDYDLERLQTFICKEHLVDDVEFTLKNSYSNKGYIETVLNDKTYYLWTEYANNDPENIPIGYEIAFIQNDALIFMHLPAIDSLENMIQYTNIEWKIVE